MSKNTRRTKARNLVVDISGPEQHSTAVSAWESPCDEKEKRSVLRFLVNALMKPCCGSSCNAAGTRRSKTKVKRIKQCTNNKVYRMQDSCVFNARVH